MSGTLDLIADENLDQLLDRLVADELTDDDRRALLTHLDASSDGWRRCSLAFLEDQVWRSALARPRVEVPKGVDRNSIPARKMIQSARYVLAASLLATGLFAAYRVGVASVERPGFVEVAAATDRSNWNQESTTKPGEPIGWVNLVNPADGESLPEQVPILAATAANEQWMRQQPATISPYVRAQWERRGFLVEEHHRLVGLDLADGRRVAIPVDEVALDFVGHQPL